MTTTKEKIGQFSSVKRSGIINGVIAGAIIASIGWGFSTNNRLNQLETRFNGYTASIQQLGRQTARLEQRIDNLRSEMRMLRAQIHHSSAIEVETYGLEERWEADCRDWGSGAWGSDPYTRSWDRSECRS